MVPFLFTICFLLSTCYGMMGVNDLCDQYTTNDICYICDEGAKDCSLRVSHCINAADELQPSSNSGTGCDSGTTKLVCRCSQPGAPQNVQKKKATAKQISTGHIKTPKLYKHCRTYWRPNILTLHIESDQRKGKCPPPGMATVKIAETFQITGGPNPGVYKYIGPNTDNVHTATQMAIQHVDSKKQFQFLKVNGNFKRFIDGFLAGGCVIKTGVKSVYGVSGKHKEPKSAKCTQEENIKPCVAYQPAKGHILIKDANWKKGVAPITVGFGEVFTVSQRKSWQGGTKKKASNKNGEYGFMGIGPKNTFLLLAPYTESAKGKGRNKPSQMNVNTNLILRIVGQGGARVTKSSKSAPQLMTERQAGAKTRDYGGYMDFNEYDRNKNSDGRIIESETYSIIFTVLNIGIILLCIICCCVILSVIGFGSLYLYHRNKKMQTSNYGYANVSHTNEV
eukprot:227173_1